MIAYCPKCNKGYLSAKCTIHRSAHLFLVYGVKDYCNLKRLLCEKIVRRSNLLFISNMTIAIILLLLVFFIGCDGIEKTSMVMRHIWWLMRESFSDVGIILILVFGQFLLPSAFYLILILTFPISYTLLVRPCILLSKSISRIFPDKMFVPVLKNYAGEYARLTFNFFIFLLMACLKIVLFVAMISGILFLLILPIWVMFRLFPHDSLLYEVILEISLILIVILLGTMVFSIVWLEEDLYQATKQWFHTRFHRLIQIIKTLISFRLTFDLMRFIYSFLITRFYPFRLYHNFYQSYSAQNAEDKIDELMEKVLGNISQVCRK